MKLTAIILVLGCLFGSLRGEAQLVSLSVKNAKLESVLKQIKNQTGYTFFFNEIFYSKASKVTLNLQGVALTDALDACFNQQVELKYTIVGRTVVVAEKDRPPNVDVQTPGADISNIQTSFITGFVYNKRFEFLANASVVVRGTQKGTTTGANGFFKLENVKTGKVLRVSYIGYKTADIIVTDLPSQTIILEEATDELDAVVSQGYSKTTTRLSTSSVSKITSEEIARQPVMNPLLALQGRVPGMVLTRVSGNAASPITIDIRGRGSLTGNSGSPLIVIDGTPLNVSTNRGAGGGMTNPGAIGDGPIQGNFIPSMSPAFGQSPLFGLNPKDIESIEVLKDVGATAIYGSNGANGVILITTKKGKAGSSRIDVNMDYGITKIIRYWDMLNTTQYLEMRREAFKNDGIVPTPINAPDLFLWDTTRNTNWQKKLWGHTGSTLNASIGFSGGTPQFTHRVSANYIRNGDITNTGNDEALGTNLSLEQRSANQKFRITLSAGYSYTYSKMTSSPPASTLPPHAPDLYDETGGLNFKEWNESGMGDFFDAFSISKQPIESRINNLTSNLTIAYQLMKGLEVRTAFGYRISSGNSILKQPIASFNPNKYPSGSTVFNSSQSNSLIAEPQLSFDSWLFRKGKVVVITGATIKQEKRQNLETLGIGYSNDALLESLTLAPYKMATNSIVPYKYAGVFGRLRYEWDNKYVVDLNGRRDGSSRFGPGNRFGNFGAIGIAWIASSEPWMKKILSPVVEFLKFYANTGTSGEDGGLNYQYLSQWGNSMGNSGLPPYDEVSPMVNLHAVNQQYRWQHVTEYNIGMRVSGLKNSGLSIELNYFRKRLADQLTNLDMPVSTGFKTVYGNNIATVQNSGWEIDVSATIIRNKNFSWSASFNAMMSRNVILAFSGIEFTNYYTDILPGQPVSMKYLLNYLGVDPLTGTYQFQDHNQNQIIDYAGNYPPLSKQSDRHKKINTQASVAGGISQSFTFKMLSVNIGMDYQIQKGPNALNTVPTPGMFGNIPLEVFNNRWQKPGDKAIYEKFSTQMLTSSSYLTNSTLYYSDASFIRLTNVSIGYALSDGFAKKLGMKTCSFGLNASNLFFITRYKGMDPEMQTVSAMPSSRNISASILLSF